MLRRSTSRYDFVLQLHGILRARTSYGRIRLPEDVRFRFFTDPTIDMTLIALNKPFGTLCQFSPHDTRPTLAAHVSHSGVYPAGRLDADSEGLLLLTDNGVLQSRITEPRRKLVKTYWAQVDGDISADALDQLSRGVDLGDFFTAPTAAPVEKISPPASLWPRDPPVRYRAAIPTTWIALSITEGKNRQVRRMTAAVGHPTLRLIRIAVGAVRLFDLHLAPGESVTIPEDAPWRGV